jgi:hypothetical protein
MQDIFNINNYTLYLYIYTLGHLINIIINYNIIYILINKFGGSYLTYVYDCLKLTVL